MQNLHCRIRTSLVVEETMIDELAVGVEDLRRTGHDRAAERLDRLIDRHRAGIRRGRARVLAEADETSADGTSADGMSADGTKA